MGWSIGRWWRFRTRWALVALVASCWTSVAMAAEGYTFGVVPQYEQRKLFAIWKPIIDELTRRTGIPLTLSATLTVPDFERELAKGSYDLVYANPYHILRESSRQGYIPLVRDKQPLRGIVVVQKDSPIRSPAELHGQTLAVPSLNALGASLLIRADLENLFNAKPVPVNVKTHTSVYMNVATGLAVAGGGVEKTFNEQAPATRDQLRVLYVTREMPPHPIAAHPRMPSADRTRIQRALLEMAATEAGDKLLDEVPIRDAIPTQLKDYLPMRSWGLESYWVE